jgi:rhamnosyltransferase
VITADSKISRVAVVVVTYYPETKSLSGLLSALIPQVKSLVVVDNTPASDLSVPILMREYATFGIHLIRLGENLGIAKALNAGIAWAMQGDATHILLSDQDSSPAADMVEKLLDVLQHLTVQGEKIGCVGPAFRDLSTGRMHKFQVPGKGGLFYKTHPGDLAIPWVEVISNITSGSLIPVHLFTDVGLMREDYFIDFVDTEWCFRARHRGYKIYGTSQAVMNHHVGDKTFLAWCGRWKSFSGYSTDRLYYQYRNGIFLLRGSFIPFGWKLRLGLTWLSNIYAYVFFAPSRLENLKAIVIGIWDGIRGSGMGMRQAKDGESVRPAPGVRK